MISAKQERRFPVGFGSLVDEELRRMSELYLAPGIDLTKAIYECH
jgi:hypothetical protein